MSKINFQSLYYKISQIILVFVFLISLGLGFLSTPVSALDPANIGPDPATPKPAATTTKPAATTAAPESTSTGDIRNRLKDCTENPTELTILNLFRPDNFVPLVPDKCSRDGDGPAALSLGAISIILVRAYGILASLVFYFFGFNLVVAGVRWSYGAFKESEATSALQTIQESGVSVVLVLIAHLVVATIFTEIFGFKEGLQTDVSTISSFFTGSK